MISRILRGIALALVIFMAAGLIASCGGSSGGDEGCGSFEQPQGYSELLMDVTISYNDCPFAPYKYGYYIWLEGLCKTKIIYQCYENPECTSQDDYGTIDAMGEATFEYYNSGEVEWQCTLDTNSHTVVEMLCLKDDGTSCTINGNFVPAS